VHFFFNPKIAPNSTYFLFILFKQKGGKEKARLLGNAAQFERGLIGG